MPRIEEGTWDGTLANDNWRSLLDLLGLPATATAARLVEGSLNVQTNGLTTRLVPPGGVVPSGSAGAGTQRAAGSVSGYGPAGGAYRGYPIGQMWVRNTSVGANATVVVEGVIALE